MIKAKYISLLLFIFTLGVVFFSSRSVYACHPCAWGYGPGDTYCIGGNLYECRQCTNSPTCIRNNGDETVPPAAATPQNVGDRCKLDPANVPSYKWDWCDNTCAVGVPDVYDVIIDTCVSCTVSSPGQVQLSTPDNGGITGADYDLATPGYQVRIDWHSLNNWGDSCGNATGPDVYELYISTNTPATAATPIIINRSAGSEYVFTGTPGTTYYWAVRAYNGHQYGAYSSEWNFKFNMYPQAEFQTLEGSFPNQPPYNVIEVSSGQFVNYVTRITDVDGNLNSAGLYRRKFTYDNNGQMQWAGAEQLVDQEPCLGSSCNISGGWLPASGDNGYWWLYLKAFDQTNIPGSPYGKCSGDPVPLGNNPTNTNVGWEFCGHRSRAMVQVRSNLNLQGYIWDATSVNSCSSVSLNTIQNNALGNNDVTPSPLQLRFSNPDNGVTPAQNWSPNQNFSYRFNNLIHSTGTSTLAMTTSFMSNDNFRYKLKCLNGNVTNTSVTSAISASFNTVVTNDPNTLHLGFEKTSTGWFSVSGTVYGGYSTGSPIDQSIVEAVPSASNVAPNFPPYMIRSNNFTYAGEATDVKNILGQAALSQSNRFVKNIRPEADTWPNSYNYQAPAGALPVPGAGGTCTGFLTSGNIDVDETYVMSAACFNQAINTLGSSEYEVNSPGGVAVVYITGTNPVIINRPVRSQDRSRILLVSAAPIDVIRAVGYPTPSIGSRAHVELGILAQRNVTFIGTADEINDPDTTIVVEGPLVVGDKTLVPLVKFDRDRGSTNNYPAHMVNYNEDYLVVLAKQVRASNALNAYGLSVVNISWEVE